MNAKAEGRELKSFWAKFSTKLDSFTAAKEVHDTN
jgi:hypothetical protein